MAEEPDPVYHLRKFRLKQMWYREEDRLLCLAPGFGSVLSFITFDSAFNYIEEHPILRDQDTVEGDFHTLVEDCYSDYWYSPDEALFFSSRGDGNHNKLRISRVNTLGEYLDYICLNERPDTIDDVAYHRCMATANDSTFYFSFYQHRYSFYPGDAVVYMLNERLEIIGRHIDEQHPFFRSALILPSADDGCITVNDSCNNSPVITYMHPKITKLRKEDFETISLSTVRIAPIATSPYPNPTSGLLYIPLPEEEFSRGRCRIFDQRGCLVADRIIDDSQGSLQLDVSGLNAGIYHYQIYTNDRTLLTERFIKK